MAWRAVQRLNQASQLFILCLTATMTLDGLKQLVESSFPTTSIVDDWQQKKSQIVCFKVDQYYYGAKPDVQRAGVQVWKIIGNETN